MKGLSKIKHIECLILCMTPSSTQQTSSVLMGLHQSLVMAEPAMDSRTPHPSTPPAWHSLAPSAVWVFSKFISYSSQVHYYISQDLLQLRYHVTELWTMDRVGRRNVNDFRDYSHKTIPRDPCFSFPVCQLDADNSAGTFRSPRRWQVQRRRSQRP